MDDATGRGAATLSERGLMARIVVLLPLCALGLRCLGFRRCYVLVYRVATLLARLQSRRPPAGDQLARAERLAALVRQANDRYSPYKAACLPRSLVLWGCLLARGIGAELRVGVRANTAPLVAHAWVEVAGRALDDVADVAETYAPFDLTSLLSTSKPR